jgi:predicted aspartyl protease
MHPLNLQIPFQIITGLIIVPVRVNGARELKMILDTGMSGPVTVLFHGETGRELGLTYGQQVSLCGAGGKEQKTGIMAAGVTLSLAGLELSQQTLVVMDESRRTSRWTLDGVIGKSIFDSYAVEIDYEKSIITVYDPRHFEVNPKSKAIPLLFRMGLSFVEAVVNLNGEGDIPVKLVVDTGGRHDLLLNTGSRKKIFPPKHSIKGMIGIGLQGEVSGTYGRVSRLRVGEFVFRDLITKFPAEDSNVGIPAHLADGNLGGGTLSRFNVIFDYPHKQMFLTPGRKFSKPSEFNMAGLLLEQDIHGYFDIREVIENSPASRAGIKRDDRIAAIDGKDIRDYPYIEVDDIFKQEGKEISVTIERESRRFDRTLTLKRLL